MTPSYPARKALGMNAGSTLPEHITRMTLVLGGYWNLEMPARSAPA
jgi:hypothetical protein